MTWYSAAADQLPADDFSVSDLHDEVEEEGDGRGRNDSDVGLRIRQAVDDDDVEAGKATKGSSKRSSWGVLRDKWNLMPSIVFWNREGFPGMT